MKTIGIIGGMSWESSLEYYRLLNEGARARLDGLHSARILLDSLDFAPVEALQAAGDWAAAGRMMAEAALRLERGGADCVVLATNTMHKCAAEIESAVSIPLLHIADAAGRRIRADGRARVGLLGTRFTMEEDFYAGRLAEKFGLDVLVPAQEARALVHRVIYDELCLGITRDESRRAYAAVIAELGRRGAEAVILGCTEIGLLVGPRDSALPLYDTTRIHVEAALDFALQG